jgi:hypothetical protein
MDGEDYSSSFTLSGETEKRKKVRQRGKKSLSDVARWPPSRALFLRPARPLVVRTAAPVAFFIVCCRPPVSPLRCVCSPASSMLPAREAVLACPLWRRYKVVIVRRLLVVG